MGTWSHRVALSTCAAWLAAAALAHPGNAQVRWRVDPKVSLAWWQVDPHLNHLWANTCPRDPSWRPGEDRTGGSSNFNVMLQSPKGGYANVVDTMQLPLYPRLIVLPLCAEAVSGHVTVADTVQWRGVGGTVSVLAEALVTGSSMRDAFARRAVLETTKYPDIVMAIDSVVRAQVGDTLSGMFMGTLTLHGVDHRVEGPVRAWREANGLRVTGRFSIPAKSMVDEFGLSKWALGLGVTTGIWRTVYMGVDLILRPEG